MNEKDKELALSIPLGVSCVCGIAYEGSVCDRHQQIVDALTAVRQEERRAAFKEAARIAGDFRRLDRDTLWSIYKTLSAETALIEAATNETKERADK